MTKTDNITVPSSGLSQLQKRILTYARRRMIEQGQTLGQDDGLGIKLYLAAPEWLERALGTLVDKLKRRRNGHICDGEFVDLNHPIINMISEANYIRDYLNQEAAIHADHAAWHGPVDVTKLYAFAIEDAKLLPRLDELRSLGMKYSPWPAMRRGRLVFYVGFGDVDIDAVRKVLGDTVDTPTAWLEDGKYYETNCTIPEMLRDLYGFPVRDGGHIDSLAFDPEAIGKDVYNKANASLRRACDRLCHRSLISIRDAHRTRLWANLEHTRTGIGMTETGVAVADELLAAQSAQAA